MKAILLLMAIAVAAVLYALLGTDSPRKVEPEKTPEPPAVAEKGPLPASTEKAASKTAAGKGISNASPPPSAAAQTSAPRAKTVKPVEAKPEQAAPPAPYMPAELANLKPTREDSYRKATYRLLASPMEVALTASDKGRYGTRKVGLYKVCADLRETKNGADNRISTGMAHIVVFDPEARRTILNTTESISRLCPS